jgi:hypothetical protein
MLLLLINTLEGITKAEEQQTRCERLRLGIFDQRSSREALGSISNKAGGLRSPQSCERDIGGV